jgi:hypothetical protein
MVADNQTAPLPRSLGPIHAQARRNGPEHLTRFEATHLWAIFPNISDIHVSNERQEVLDSLEALSAFVRAAEARSFTDAGRQLGLSSSAIGKTVARLERASASASFIAAHAASR